MKSKFKKVKNRYTVRKFSGRKVEKEKLDLLLEIGNIAPTGKNLQPQRIYVAQSEESLAKVDEATHCRYGAGTVLIFTYNVDEDWKNPLEVGVHSGVQDVSIVATHIMLLAEELGLGICWCNYFSNSKLEELFNIPNNERSVLIKSVGYPADDSAPSPMYAAHKEIDEIVKYL